MPHAHTHEHIRHSSRPLGTHIGDREILAVESSLSGLQARTGTTSLIIDDASTSSRPQVGTREMAQPVQHGVKLVLHLRLLRATLPHPYEYVKSTPVATHFALYTSYQQPIYPVRFHFWRSPVFSYPSIAVCKAWPTPLYDYPMCTSACP